MAVRLVVETESRAVFRYCKREFWSFIHVRIGRKRFHLHVLLSLDLPDLLGRRQLPRFLENQVNCYRLNCTNNN